jgi:uncharacterized membrane protein
MTTAVETRRDVEAASEAVSRPRLSGLFLGIGLGGFVDGIVLHQSLQWHHMLTSEGDYPKTTVAGLETNTLGNGLFHAVTWIVDHQILTIHHVREGADNTWLYDGGFLAFGALLLVGGWLLTRSAEARLIKPS